MVPLLRRRLSRAYIRTMTDDLFGGSAAATAASNDYTASAIEVLEGLEPVRRRPGMYIGGIDERALHHLASEVLDNSMDEAVAGHASRIEVHLGVGNRLTITDNGRGIPVDPHPKFPDKSALEVILTTLHSGGKFTDKAYATSGGLHGVGVSVVNALSIDTLVEVARNKQLYRQRFAQGHPVGKLEELGPTPNRRGTTIAFTPDPEILVPTQSLSLRACSVLRGQKPIYLRASKFVGAAMRNWPAQMCLPKRCFNSPAVCPTICVSSLAPAPVPQPNSSPERRIFPTHKGVLNGRFHGPYIRTVPIAGIATPSPRPMAVRMKRACALRLRRDRGALAN